MVGAASPRRHLASFLALSSSLQYALARDTNCGCGYLDPVTKDLWTDTTILYFNETNAAELASNVDFVDLQFENLYESGFSTTYRQSAIEANIGLNEDNSLQLAVSPPTMQHLVAGSGIRTTRQDIQYGSFRAAMQPAQQVQGISGTAMSMYYHYNVSQNIEIDLVNGDRQSNNALFRAALPTGSLPSGNYSFANISSDTYGLHEWRFDWTKKSLNFSTELNSTVGYNVSSKHYTLPSVPGAIFFKHWSNGDPSITQGPPLGTAHALVGYIRLFYNSTITSANDVFEAQCQILQQAVCSTEDYTLRTSSEFSTDSTAKWKLVVPAYKPPAWAIFGVTISGTILGLVIVHAIIRRLIRHYSIPKADRPVHPGAYTYKLDRFALHGELTREMVKEKKRTEKEEKRAIARGETPIVKAREIDPDAASITSFATTNEPDQSSVRGFRSLASNKNSKVIASALPTMYYARPGSAQGGRADNPKRGPSRLHEVTGEQGEGDDEYEEDDGMLTPRARSNSDASLDEIVDEAYSNLPGRESDEMDRGDDSSTVAFRAAVSELPKERKKSLFRTLEVARPGKKFWSRFFSDAPTKEVEVKRAVLEASARIDYLDGLRGLACLLVSLVHFSLTFYPGFIEDLPPFDLHYPWVRYIRYTIGPFFFNANFGLGIFFILSSRLIGVRFLKSGHLQDLAGSTFRRIPRLAFPILCSVTLEYFLIGVGATQYLQYLASVTWSTWPYAVEFDNIAHWINEYLALLFVQPPQLPEIIYNYCTGVLWTIPVSIQGSWLIFLGVIVIREIKTPWKRFGYYFFCMLNSWYALNWGGYFWIGLAISDLDVTYRYRSWGVKRWRSWAIVLSLWAVIILFMSTQYIQQVSWFNLPTFENAVHPDLFTGLPIGQTINYGYPAFNLPQVYSLFASTGIVLLCDFSNVMQKILNIRFLRALGYYSYSIYLLHGVIFWSWGSWLCVVLSTKGVHYWVNILIVFITSYLLLAFSVYLWTPFADVFSGYAGTALWRRAQGRSFFATMG